MWALTQDHNTARSHKIWEVRKDTEVQINAETKYRVQIDRNTRLSQLCNMNKKGEIISTWSSIFQIFNTYYGVFAIYERAVVHEARFFQIFHFGGNVPYCSDKKTKRKNFGNYFANEDLEC